MDHRHLADHGSRFVEKDDIMLLFTPVNSNIDRHRDLLLHSKRVTGAPSLSDQLTVFLLWRSGRSTLLTVHLDDLGDSPQSALTALEFPGPQFPGRVPDRVNRPMTDYS